MWQSELENLYDGYNQQLYLCALAVTGCRDRAEDAVHEAFSRLLKLERKPQNTKAYAFQSVRNAAIDFQRRNGKTSSLVEDCFADPKENPRNIAAQRQMQRRVAQALETLGPDERETIIQHLYAGLTFREIAEMRNCPQGTVVSWHRRGLEKLRGILEE